MVWVVAIWIVCGTWAYALSRYYGSRLPRRECYGQKGHETCHWSKPLNWFLAALGPGGLVVMLFICLDEGILRLPPSSEQ